MLSFKSLPLLFLLLLLFVPEIHASLWSDVSASRRSLLNSDAIAERQFRADQVALKRILARADFEGRNVVSSTIELPLANGTIKKFRLEQSPIMAPGLAAKFPDIKTFRVTGMEDPALTGRLSLTSKGFHGMISGPQGTVYIDPQSTDRYRVYKHGKQPASTPFQCGVKGHTLERPVSASRIAKRSVLRTPGSLRVYRLAVAATAQYTNEVKKDTSVTTGEMKVDAMAEITIAINRVNEIYNRDLGIKLVLVVNNDFLIYSDAASDPYTNDSSECPSTDIFCDPGSLMLEENQQNLDAVLNPAPGDDNYDIGHVFSTGGGGIAEVASVCSNLKAGGVTGSPSPQGDAFYIDYVAHEIGHQFSGEHTFSGTEQSCGSGNRWSATAFEPGSGSTIMSYAGICGLENISRNAIAMFHAGTINLVDNFTTSGLGASCGTTEPLANLAAPTVEAGQNYLIPAQTPFILSAIGQDNDGDTLTYSWDQMDAGTATNSTTFGQDLGDNSLFRSYLPRVENERYFPALGTTLQNLYDQSEVLACSVRNINFRVTVLDGNSGIGQDDVTISVTDKAGPFVITSHTSSQSLAPGEAVLTWNVAHTDVAPVSCATVDISLLTFNADKSRYGETLLAAGVVNDGSAAVTIPNNASSIARFKIQCSDNIFYDISDADLSISGNQPFTNDAKPVFYNTDGNAYTLGSIAPKCDLSNLDNGGTTTTTTTSSSSGGVFRIIDLIALGILLLILTGKSFYTFRLKAHNAA